MAIYSFFTGIPLPKKFLCPFKVEGFNLQKKSEILYSGKKIRIELFNFVAILSAIIATAGIVILVVVYTKKEIIFSDWIDSAPWFLPLEIFIIMSMLISTVSYFKYYKTQNLIFNRVKSTLSIPINYSTRTITANWSDWTARIYEDCDSKEFSFSFIHLPTRNIYNPINSTKDINELLSFWSFIVTYMDKATSDLIDSDKNLDDYFEKFNSTDPWQIWLEELNLNPNLDVLNNSNSRV